MSLIAILAMAYARCENKQNKKSLRVISNSRFSGLNLIIWEKFNLKEKQNNSTIVNKRNTPPVSQKLARNLSKSINSNSFLTQSFENMIKTVASTSIPTSSLNLGDNNDDYEYDIPSNNKPLATKLKGVNPSLSNDSVSSNASNLSEKQIKNSKHISMSSESPSVSNERKSSSPTIDDSGSSLTTNFSFFSELFAIK